MKNLKKVITLLLAVLMIASVFAGCGEKKPDTTTAAGGNNETTVGKTTEPEVKEPVKLRIMTNNVLPEDSVSMTWVKKLEEKCNVSIEWVLPPASGYNDQLQLTLLEDKLPDAMLIPTNWLQLDAFVDSYNSGRFLNLADMVKNYPNIMAHTLDVSWDALDINHDGGICGMPRSTMIRADGFSIIKEWCDACKIDYKEGEYLTIDEFYDMAYKFAHNDPDGNGVDDTYGFKTYGNGVDVLWTGLEGAFSVGAGWLEESPGFYMTAKYSKEKDNYKRYLAFLNKCWTNGVLDPDSFAIDYKTSLQRHRSNMYGMWGDFAAAKDYRADDGDKRTTLLCPGVVQKQGDHYGSAEFSNGIWNFWAISSQCEHPEKVLEIFDYILGDEGWQDVVGRGIEGVHYKITADGEWDFSEWNAKVPNLTADQRNGALMTQVVRRSDGADFFVNRSMPKEVRELCEKYVKVACDNAVISLDRGFKPEIAKDTAYIEYTAYMNDEINKIIAGKRDLNTYDELLDGWYKAGGQQYVDEMNAYITEMEAKSKK